MSEQMRNFQEINFNNSEKNPLILIWYIEVNGTSRKMMN